MRTLEQWARETPAGLRRAESAAEAQLRDLGQHAYREIQRRSKGSMARAVEVTQTDDHTVTLTSDHPGAAIAEHGGTIHGKPWLAVPLHQFLEQLPGPRSDPADLFVLNVRGRLFLASRDSGILDVRWRLASSVRIGAHPAFGPGLETAREGFAERVLGAMTAEVMP